MSQTLAVEWGNRGIRFNTVSPGPFPTEGAHARLLPGRSASSEAEAGKSKVNPMGRVGQPVDIANAILFLASDEARYITGAALPVDGGRSAVLVTAL